MDRTANGPTEEARARLDAAEARVFDVRVTPLPARILAFGELLSDVTRRR
jgi:hypothetical protein